MYGKARSKRRGENSIATKTVEKEHKKPKNDRACRVVAEGEGVVAGDEGCVAEGEGDVG